MCVCIAVCPKKMIQDRRKKENPIGNNKALCHYMIHVYCIWSSLC